MFKILLGKLENHKIIWKGPGATIIKNRKVPGPGLRDTTVTIEHNGWLVVEAEREADVSWADSIPSLARCGTLMLVPDGSDPRDTSPRVKSSLMFYSTLSEATGVVVNCLIEDSLRVQRVHNNLWY